MNSLLNFGVRALVLTALFAAGNVVAGPGHDHGTPAAVAGKASPRFEAQSDLFEAVGILSNDTLSIFIDRFNSNEPVLNAKVEVESGIAKLTGKFRVEHGDFSFPSKSFEKPGAYAITLTITVGDEVEILAGNLVVPDSAAGHSHAHGGIGWKSGAAIATLIVILGIAAIIFTRRRSAGISHV